MKWILLIVFVALGVAGYLGHLDPVIALLQSEQMSFTIGKTQISAFMVIKAVLSVVFLFWVASFVSGIVRYRVNSLKQLSSTNKAIIGNISSILIYIAAFLVVIEFLGIDITALAVFSGAIGIGLGFGLQKVTSNFISGIILLFEKSIEEGDLVQLADGTTGYIRRNGPRFTLMEAFDGREVMIPNEEFISNRVVNWTFTDESARVDIPVGISYDADPEKAKQIMLDTAKAHPRCSQKKDPTCFMTEFADSSVNFILYFWVDDVANGKLGPKSDVMFSIYKAFKENGIEIPYPQRDVHVKSGQV